MADCTTGNRSGEASLCQRQSKSVDGMGRGSPCYLQRALPITAAWLVQRM
jgi:hypothetical protein